MVSVFYYTGKDNFTYPYSYIYYNTNVQRTVFGKQGDIEIIYSNVRDYLVKNQQSVFG